MCAHDALDKEKQDLLCAQCKGNVVVTLKTRADKCEDSGSDGDFSEDSVQKLWEPYTLKPMAVAGTHRALKERCIALQEKLESKMPALTTEFNKSGSASAWGAVRPKLWMTGATFQ